jgi:type VII secretion integral membrane protein EccD
MLASAIAFTPLDGPEASAVIVTAALLLGPVLPAVSVRLGRVPLPQLPRTPEDLVRSEPVPDAGSLAAATARTDQILTGMLIGSGLASGVAFAVLVASGGLAGLLLTAAVSLAYLLRSRFYVGIRHRAPLLLTGASGLGLLGVLPAASGFAVARLAIVLPVAFVAAVLGLMAFSVYSRRMVSPRLGRLADVLDVVLTLAVVPLACGVFGLFAYMRGFGG